ncbi:MAG TPA: SDR family oxidoreductase [Chloroflexota bacterium]|nr:SDR family oxidoreductase [Chloroflexota bacterium]
MPGVGMEAEITRALEAAGYRVSLVSAAGLAEHPDAAGFEGGLEHALRGEFEMLVLGEEIFPRNVDPDQSLTLGLRRAFLACKLVVRSMMRNRFGRIIAFAPASDTTVVPAAAAREALGGLMKSIAREVGTRGITANVIAPGTLEENAALSPYVAVARPARPADIGSVLQFLAGDSASYLTGQVMAVDGGVTTT